MCVCVVRHAAIEVPMVRGPAGSTQFMKPFAASVCKIQDVQTGREEHCIGKPGVFGSHSFPVDLGAGGVGGWGWLA